MQKVIISVLLLAISLIYPSKSIAAQTTPGWNNAFICSVNTMITPTLNDNTDPCKTDANANSQNLIKYMAGSIGGEEQAFYNPGILGIQSNVISMLYDNQVSGQEYIADIAKNIGLPQLAPPARAQGTGYQSMKPFLEVWKVFRNLAYSLYIIMFVVVGIMIMLRTKVNAQTIISIQTALPNLLITLILITFSYAIVGFMIDIMYFLIYFVVYLMDSANLITASTAISRLMSYSAWSIVFEGRNTIISAVTASMRGIFFSLGTGALGAITGFAGGVDYLLQSISFGMMSPIYLFVSISFVIAMLKLMVALIKSYVMLIVQTITAPVQILMNAMPGSKAFSTWLKTTASYLLPFPVAACMFIFSAVLIGNPTSRPFFSTQQFGFDFWGSNDSNPFGVNENNPMYQNSGNIWMPPFTLTNSSLLNGPDPKAMDILTLLGFFVFLMTPAAVKMAQDWLQVKESPYTAEAFASAGMGVNAGMMIPKWLWHQQQEDIQMKRQAKLFNDMKSGNAYSGKHPSNQGTTTG